VSHGRPTLTRDDEADGAEGGEAATELGLGLGPDRPQRPHALARARGARAELDAERLELLLEPAHADAQLDATAAEAVERGDLLGQHHRVALGEDQDAGGQADGGRRRRHVAEPHQRVGNVERLAAGHLARRVVRVLRVVARGHDDVLHGPQRLEAHLLGRPGHRGGGRSVGEGSGVGEDESELHVAGP
jgi:hypothetical protein